MKKLIALVGLIALTLSCSSESEKSTNKNKELIYGSWKLSERFDENGKSLDIDECSKKGTLIIKPTGTYDYIEFEIINGECKENGTKTTRFDLTDDRMIIYDGDYQKQAWINFPDENTFEFTEIVDEVNEVSGEFPGIKDVWKRAF